MLAKAAGPLIGKQGLSKRDVSKVMSGIILYTLAVQLLKAFGSDDDDPTVLNIPGVGPIRVSAYNPVSTFLILANISHRHNKGKRPLKSSSDLLALIGRDTRYPNLGMEWFDALVDLGGTERDKVTKFREKSQMVAGRSVAAYIRALTTLKAINQAFDGEEAILRDYMDEPFVGELKKVAPFSEKLNKLITGNNSLLKENALTGMPEKAENTIFNQLGLTIIPQNQTGPKFSPVEEYLDNELAEKRKQAVKFYKTPEERRSAAIAGQLYSAIDKGVDVSKRVADYVLRGVLSKNQSRAILDANRATSSLERKALESTIVDLATSYDYASDSEKELLKAILIKKARSQHKNGSLSDQEINALKEVFPELR
jgi:predicted small metal-binding protein